MMEKHAKLLFAKGAFSPVDMMLDFSVRRHHMIKNKDTNSSILVKIHSKMIDETTEISSTLVNKKIFCLVYQGRLHEFRLF